MIKAKEVLQTMGGSSQPKIPVGIHTDCKVTSLEVGANWIDINFEDKQGRVQNNRIWYPDPAKVYPRDGETTEETIGRDLNERVANVVKIMSIFMEKEAVDTFSAPTFDEFVKRAAATLTPLLSTKTVNLKLIYDSEGQYSTFGKYPNYIEEYVEGSQPTIRYSEWEMKNRTTPSGSRITDSNDPIVGDPAMDINNVFKGLTDSDDNDIS